MYQSGEESVEQHISKTYWQQHHPTPPHTKDYFALFRTALEDESQKAWEQIQLEYTPLIHSWLTNYAGKSLCLSFQEDLTQEAYLRFWRSLTKGDIPLSHRFPHLGAILKYLKQCTKTALIDWQRQQRLQVVTAELETAVSHLHTNIHDHTENPAYDSAQLWRVKQWIRREVRDDKEQIILQLSFGHGLSPKQIVALHPHLFPTPRHVYRIKDRLLKRARRSLLLTA